MRILSSLRRDDSQPASHPSQAAKIPRVLRKEVMLINNKTCIPVNSRAEVLICTFRVMIGLRTQGGWFIYSEKDRLRRNVDTAVVDR